MRDAPPSRCETARIISGLAAGAAFAVFTAPWAAHAVCRSMAPLFTPLVGY